MWGEMSTEKGRATIDAKREKFTKGIKKESHKMSSQISSEENQIDT